MQSSFSVRAVLGRCYKESQKPTSEYQSLSNKYRLSRWPKAAFLNLFLPQHPTPKQSSTPYQWLTPDYYKDKVKTSAVHLDHMLNSFSKTKTAIMAVALTKTN